MNQRIIIIALAAIILILGGLVVHLLRTNKQNADQYEAVIQEKNDVITYHKNKEGQLIAEKASAAISQANAQIVYAKELARVRLDFNLKTQEVNHLKNFLQAGFVVRDTGTTVIQTIYNSDSTKKIKELKVTDGYLTLNADVTQEIVPWNYSYIDTLTAIGIVKKKGFLGLGRENYFIQAKLQNKKAMITSVKSFRIEEFRDRRFSVGPSVGWYPFIPGPQINKLQIGISVTYGILRF